MVVKPRFYFFGGLRLCIFCLFFFWSLNSCATLRALVGLDFQQPRLEVFSIGFEGFSSEGLNVNIGVRVQNPNDFGVTLENLSYSLSIAGLRAAFGAYGVPLPIAAQSRSEVVLPLTITLDSGMDKLIAGIVRGEQSELLVNTQLTGLVATDLGSIEVSHNDERTLPLRLGK